MPLLALFALLLLTSCLSSPPAEEAPLQHARWLSMSERIEGRDTLTLVAVRNPWDTASTLRRYVLVPRKAELSDETLQKLPAEWAAATVVRTPVARSVATNTPPASLALRLGVGHRLAGMCDPQYAVADELRQARWADYGSAAAPSVERLVADRVDAVLVAPFENANHGSLETTGIPLIECADYMESTPLGRAEWMRFYGRLWGVGARADSLFAAETHRYASLRDSVAQAGGRRPRLLVDKMWSGTWMVPGGGSFMAQLYRDAGADYVFADLPGAGSRSWPLEQVLQSARSADLWVIKYGGAADLTLSALAMEHPIYRQFAAYGTGRVYGCNTLRLPYYDELPFAPSALLREWVEMVRGKAGRYFKRVP